MEHVLLTFVHKQRSPATSMLPNSGKSCQMIYFLWPIDQKSCRIANLIVIHHKTWESPPPNPIWILRNCKQVQKKQWKSVMIKWIPSLLCVQSNVDKKASNRNSRTLVIAFLYTTISYHSIAAFSIDSKSQSKRLSVYSKIGAT